MVESNKLQDTSFGNPHTFSHSAQGPSSGSFVAGQGLTCRDAAAFAETEAAVAA